MASSEDVCILDTSGPDKVASQRRRDGAIAQLGERYNGIVEVGGSIPPGSTNIFASAGLRVLASLVVPIV